MACNDYNSCCYLLYDPTWTKKNEKKRKKRENTKNWNNIGRKS
jgi:hypothetical protein